MTISRVVAFALLSSLFLGCSDADTVLALTVTSKEDVGEVTMLHVTVNQQGQAPFVHDFAPPRITVEAGSEEAGYTLTMPISPSFFERMTLPSSWPDGAATVTVTTEGGGPAITGTTQAPIEAHETVAATVKLTRMPPPVTSDAGVDGGDAAAADAGDASNGDAALVEASADAASDAVSSDAGDARVDAAVDAHVDAAADARVDGAADATTATDAADARAADAAAE
jgi:hypothetical protein